MAGIGGKTMAQVIAHAKKKHKKGFNQRLSDLKKCKALTSIIKKSNTGTTSLYLQFFAAVSTDKQVAKLLKKTKGKHFVVSGSQSEPKVVLVKNKTHATSQNAGVEPFAITCWQGWVAFWAWWVGSEMTCVAFGAAVGVGMSPTGPMAGVGGIIAGSACSGLMAYLAEEFIDFESACAKLADPMSIGWATEAVRNDWEVPHA
jgi:hypothetical protein